MSALTQPKFDKFTLNGKRMQIKWGDGCRGDIGTM